VPFLNVRRWHFTELFRPAGADALETPLRRDVAFKRYLRKLRNAGVQAKFADMILV
jgi:hypothetical protein